MIIKLSTIEQEILNKILYEKQWGVDEILSACRHIAKKIHVPSPCYSGLTECQKRLKREKKKEILAWKMYDRILETYMQIISKKPVAILEKY